ncbi:glycoside hydrolase, family 30 [Aquipluma nitroreducens]|uniref:Glycoside hydrolase, family 30 n=1 Tax=Aquipluma nitroreducens TaxID=2010828 RepID=A0A5K7S6N1_9BACT|nr:glycoside hydrolase family 30 protein [Aquipluma nitroreducens]BBE17213.1 glycoside hydrolase, family 30 [Aquipluma nitroreducens]
MNKIKTAFVLSLLATVACTNKPATQNGDKPLQIVNPEKAQIFVTARDTSLRLSQTADATFENFGQPFETQVCVFVDPTRTFQTFIGIGGALTDASAEVFAKLPEATQKEFMTAYYDKNKGIGYNFSRTNIASCDFSSDTYAYVTDKDTSLNSFNVAHDEKFRIPFIKQAIAAAGGTLPMFVSPWSPPAWMKDNDDVLLGGKLLPEYAQVWANHYVKFIKTYESMGMPIWGLSVQNEPMAKQKWESCLYTAEDERDFVKKYLGPTLQKNGLNDKKLICWDHNRDLIYQRATTLLNDPEASKYIWGIGFHWYETWTGSAMQFENLKRVKEAFPEKELIFTEGCVEKFDLNRVNDWSLGERYGNSMVNDFNCGTVAWTDWNILLDENGGPNHVGNFCFAPIHADTKTGKLIYTNSYYYIGHFSKFIQPGAKRIGCSTNRDKLQATAFLNPDGKIVVVVLNLSDSKLPYQLWISGKAAPVTSLPHSIMTVVI